MGIKVNVSMKQDYSYLFKGMSGNVGSNMNFLSDYASIKNGSYGKLMKAYYGKNSSKEVSSLATQSQQKNTTTDSETVKAMTAIESAADKLKESADKLLTKGTKSLFTEENIADKNGIENIAKAVTEFASDYNDLLKQAGSTTNISVQNKAKTMIGITDVNEDLLGKIGITVNKDNSLSVDTEKLKTADTKTVKSLFNGNSSYAYRVSAQSSLIDFAAQSEKNKAKTYTAAGTYSATSSGSLFDYGF